MEQITIDFLPAGATAVCHASQFDAGRVIRINLRNDGAVYTLSGSEIIKAKITRPDGTTIEENIENTSSSYVDLVTSAGTCDVSGTNHGELVIEKDGATIGTKNFRMEIEEDAYGGAGDVVIESASGAIASFETDIEDELVELKAEIEPVQDLHGYTHPWAGGAGKNKLEKSFAYYRQTQDTLADMFFISAGTYTFHFSETTVSTWRYFVRLKDSNGNPLSDEEHKPVNNMDFCSTINAWVNQANTTIKQIIITIIEDCYIRIGFWSGETTETTTFTETQLEEGSSATAWEPYENICPISGHDEVNITHTGKNLIKNVIAQGQSANHVLLGQSIPNTHETFLKKGTYSIRYKTVAANKPSIYMKEVGISQNIKLNNYATEATFEIEHENFYRFWIYRGDGVNASDISEAQIELGSSATEYEQYAGETKKIEFDDTVYSAELDAKNGELAKDGYIESYNGETIEEPWISSKDAFVPGTTPTAGAQVVYKKSNPDKVATGKANFSTLTDQTNHVYNDTGDTSLKYYKREGRATA